MNAYRSYMDRVKLPRTAHARLMKALAAGERPARRTAPLVKYGAWAACLALVCLGGWGLFRLIAPVGGEPGGPSVTPPAVVGVPDPLPTETPAATAGDGLYALTPAHTEAAWAKDNNGIAMTAEDMQAAVPTYVMLEYGAPDSELMVDLAPREEGFSVRLTREQMVYLLGGPEAEDAPWQLFWSGFNVTGEALYDGEGNLWRVVLTGEDWTGIGAENGAVSFTMILRPGAFPEDGVIYPETVQNDVDGVAVYASRFTEEPISDHKKGVFDVMLMDGDTGIRLRAASAALDDAGGWLAQSLADFAAGYFASPEGGIHLDRLMTAEVPDQRVGKLSLDEARAEEDLGQYVPASVPDGFAFGNAWREQGRNRDYLSVSWNKGYNNIEVTIHGAGRYEEADSDEEPIPAGELTAQAVKERMKYVDNDAGDRPGWRGRFAVAFADGVTVELSLKGVTPEEAFLLAESMTGK